MNSIDYRDCFSDAVVRRISSIIKEETRAEVVEFILHVQNDIRLYLLSGDFVISTLWERIRKSEAVTDFIISVTHEFNFHLSHTEHCELIDRISRAFSINYKEGSAIDEDLFSRLVDTSELSSELGSNPWLVTIYMIDMFDVELLSSVKDG